MKNMNERTAIQRYTKMWFKTCQNGREEMMMLYSNALKKFGETRKEEAAQYVLDHVTVVKNV